MKKEKDSSMLSIPDEKVLYGVTIKKMPIGRYVKATRLLKNLPNEFIAKFLDGMNEQELLNKYKNVSTETIVEVFVNLIDTLPDFAFNFLSELLDIEKDIIENELAPVEIVEILQAFWEVNRLEDFFTKILQLKEQIKK